MGRRALAIAGAALRGGQAAATALGYSHAQGTMGMTTGRGWRGDSLEALRDLLARATQAYKRALISRQPGLVWDYVALTAANEHQAVGYRHELALRSSPHGPLGPFFPLSQRTIVVPDPTGVRAGSGGATLGVLQAIARDQRAVGGRKPFEALRILVVHSGGASQRLPLYSPLGKIFTPLPMIRPDGQLMTLFDHLYLLLAALPPRLGPGMLTAAGDVMLLFDAEAVPAPPPGVTALAIRTAAALGRTHGVFQATDSSLFPRVGAAMQKATVEEMRNAGLTDARDRVLIDSGLLFFDAAATTALYRLSRRYSPAWQQRTRRQIDLYSEIVPAALDAAPPPAADPVTRRLHADLRAALSRSPLRCFELPGGQFLHLGTTRQFRDALTGRDPSPACALFRQNVHFAGITAVPRSARIFQSVISGGPVSVGRHVVIENCLLRSRLAIGAGSVLSNLSMTGSGPPLTVPRDLLIYGVPIRQRGKSATAHVILGVHDDPKSSRTLCNMDLDRWLVLAGLSAEDLWERSERQRSLWNARLFPAQAGLHAIQWMARPSSLTPAQRRRWRRATRYSMADILELADPTAMVAHRDAISGLLQATQWTAAVRAHSAASVQNAVHHFGPPGYQHLVDLLFAEAQNAATPPLIRARLAWSLAEIESRPLFPRDEVVLPASPASLQRQAFDNIREAMTPPQGETRKSRIEDDSPIIASAPVRLDFSGGWTDTPPYCLENGGAVLNVAINLNDVEPVQSTFQRLDEPVVRLASRDLGTTLVVTDPGRLLAPLEPDNPFALHITALRLTGLAPTARETSQRKWLSRLGDSRRGFELATASNLPKGSGMGTSSILGAATLAVLRAAAGMDSRPAVLCQQTLLLEQQLGTGGGWQDQVGGVIGGAKITETTPGLQQRLNVRRIPLSAAQAAALQDRLVVYFTGQQRLARNILRQVMGRYLSREPATVVLFNELIHSAHACEAALRKSDWLACAAEINHYWRIKKDLFPGSTTSAVDALFLELRPYYLGGCLAGAGGGGFAFFLCRDPDQAHRLRSELAAHSARPGSLGLTFTATVNRTGLRVTRLPARK